MDNETARWLSAEDYAREVVKYSKAMKAVDTTIKIGMLTYDFTEKIPEMLEIAGKHIDFFADRDDQQEGRLENLISLLNNYNLTNGTTIKYCNTEWQVHPYGAPNPKEQVDERFLYGHKTKIKRAMVLGTWYCGLKATGYLMHWQRKGEIVDFVNFNNLSNTHGQAVIETPKEGAYLTAPGKVYELLSRTPARWPLVIEKYDAKRDDIIQGQAAYSLNKDTLVIYALNRSDTAKIMEFDFSLLEKDFSVMNISMLDADDIFARNKIDKPNEIRRTDRVEKINKNHVRLQSPGRSFIQAILTTRE
jgi:alpha-L-arabinofuranosidase